MPTALVLSAGGMYAAWEAGVWKALCGRVRPDMVVGASAGAWNGWAIAGGCGAEELIRIWMDPVTATILQPGIHRGGLVRPAMLYRKAQELFDQFRPRVRYGLTMVEVPRIRPQVAQDREVTWKHLAATCSIPVVFPPVRIDGKRYVDGGVVGALPLWAAEVMGATRAIALNVLTTLPFRALRRVMRPPMPGPEMQVTLLEPSARLGRLRDAVRWSRGNIERWIELGERDGNRLATSITM